MDTKIAAALNNLNLNSQQKKIINEVLDNKFKYIEPNVIKFDNIQIYEERLVLEEEFYDEKLYSITHNYKDYYRHDYCIDLKIPQYIDKVICCGSAIEIENFSLDYAIGNNAGFNFEFKRQDSNETEYFNIIYDSLQGINSTKPTFELKSTTMGSINSTILDFKLNPDQLYYVTRDINTNNQIFYLNINRNAISYQSLIKGLSLNISSSTFTYLSTYNSIKFEQSKIDIHLYSTTGKTSILNIKTDRDNNIILNSHSLLSPDFIISNEINDSDNSNRISVKDSIQDIYNKIDNNSNNINYITQNIQDITQNIQDINDMNYITQSFIDKEIEELIYKTAETMSKANEYDITGNDYKELVISEKEYNKYNYTWEDNSVHNYLYEQYNKIVVYKDILAKTINITNSNGEQEEINVLIVE